MFINNNLFDFIYKIGQTTFVNINIGQTTFIDIKLYD